MVRQCYICKIYNYQKEAQSQEVSFHRFPLNIERRNTWISLLGFDKNHQFPKRVEICSNHFQESDFEVRWNGCKCLKRDAVPLPVHSAFEHRESTRFPRNTEINGMWGKNCEEPNSNTAPKDQVSLLSNTHAYNVEEKNFSLTTNVADSEIPLPETDLHIKTEIKEEIDEEMLIKTEENERDERNEEGLFGIDKIEVKEEDIEESSLQAAIKTENYESLTEECSSQNNSFNRDGLSQAMPENPQPPDLYTSFHCGICNYKTKRLFNINDHLLSCHIEIFKDCKATSHNYLKMVHNACCEVPMFSCSLCGYKSKYKHYLDRHCLVHEAISEEFIVHKCDLCIYKTKSRHDLISHLLVHTDSSEEPKFSKCNLCGFQVKSLVDLKKHLWDHTNVSKVRWHKCDLCPFKTEFRSDLKRHNCEITLFQEAFEDISGLQPSFKQGQFQCGFCEFRARSERGLKKHEDSHLAKKVFKRKWRVVMHCKKK